MSLKWTSEDLKEIKENKREQYKTQKKIEKIFK